MKVKPDDYAAIRAAVLDYVGRFPGAADLYDIEHGGHKHG